MREVSKRTKIKINAEKEKLNGQTKKKKIIKKVCNKNNI